MTRYGIEFFLGKHVQVVFLNGHVVPGVISEPKDAVGPGLFSVRTQAVGPNQKPETMDMYFQPESVLAVAVIVEPPRIYSQ